MSIIHILLGIALTFYSVNGRTCTCAQFISTECNGQDNCQWNTRLYNVGEIKGDHGICRSDQWLECHKNEDCTLEGRFVGAVDAEGYPVGGGQRRQLVEDDVDWPWNCDTGEYYAQAINVAPYELLAMKSRPTEIDHVANTQSMNIVWISLIGLLIGVAACYKFKNREKKQFERLDTMPESYATF